MGKRGPAPKGEYEGKTSVFSTRIRPDTKKALQAAAKKSGRSLSNEVEHRLRRSFDEDIKLVDLFGDRQRFAIMRLIASVLEQQAQADSVTSIVEQQAAAVLEQEDEAGSGRRRPRRNWMNDPVQFDRLVETIVAVLTAFRPPEPAYDPNENHGWGRVLDKVAAEGAAEKVLRSIVDAPDALPVAAGSRDPTVIKADLTRDALRRLRDYADWLRMLPSQRGALLGEGRNSK